MNSRREGGGNEPSGGNIRLSGQICTQKVVRRRECKHLSGLFSLSDFSFEWFRLVHLLIIHCNHSIHSMHHTSFIPSFLHRMIRSVQESEYRSSCSSIIPLHNVFLVIDLPFMVGHTVGVPNRREGEGEGGGVEVQGYVWWQRVKAWALGVEKKGERKRRRTVLEWWERGYFWRANWKEMDNIIYTFSWFEPFDTLNEFRDWTFTTFWHMLHTWDFS